MYANVLKFHILIPHEIFFFLSQLSPILEVFSFDKITLKSHIFVLLYRHGQAVLESSSVRVRQLGA